MNTFIRNWLCSFENVALQREWNRREPGDIDGKAVRPSERARVSQYHDESTHSC
jgi:hypothetical protein